MAAVAAYSRDIERTYGRFPDHRPLSTTTCPPTTGRDCIVSPTRFVPNYSINGCAGTVLNQLPEIRPVVPSSLPAADFRSFLLKALMRSRFSPPGELEPPSLFSEQRQSGVPQPPTPSPTTTSLRAVSRSLVRWRKPSTSTLRCIASHRLLSTKSFSASMLPYKMCQHDAGTTPSKT